MTQSRLCSHAPRLLMSVLGRTRWRMRWTCWESRRCPLMTARRSTRAEGSYETCTSSSTRAPKGMRELRRTAIAQRLSFEGHRAGARQRTLLFARLQAQLHGKPQKSKYRDESHALLPRAEGDLARSRDEQLLDAFKMTKLTTNSAPTPLRLRILAPPLVSLLHLVS